MTYLTDEDFFNIYSKVPRLNIDLVIKSDEDVLYALRTIEPNIGQWHLPGGTVYKGETINDAAKRIAKKETGLDIRVKKCLGFMEFPNEIRMNQEIHTISIVLETEVIGGEIRHDENAKEVRYFTSIPENSIKEHGEFMSQL
jgi:colanic acid biosynthesis protein WcaH